MHDHTALPDAVFLDRSNDPTKWRTGIPHYRCIRVEELYAGIDLVLYGNPQQPEYDFVVAPGADPGQIRLAVSGAEDMRIDDAGNLLLAVPGGKLVQKTPRVYQKIGGERRLVSGGYRLLAAADAEAGKPEQQSQPLTFRPESPTLIGFQVAAYDLTQPLIIDPVIVYSTYLGGSGNDQGYDIALDDAGNAYVVGSTRSPSTDFSNDFPTKDPIFADPTIYFNDVFVFKFNANGSELVFSTIVGGSSNDVANL
jgi:hypothetical protein